MVVVDSTFEGLRSEGACRATRLILGGALLCLACSEPPAPSLSSVVDTLPSGRIVTRNADQGMWTPEVRWRLEHVVRIGTLEGSAESTFGLVADVALGPSSNVYVLDNQASVVRVFDLEGEHQRDIGSPGQGPGELASPYAIDFDENGHLWIADGSNRRYTEFDLEGQLIRSVRSSIRGGIGRGQLRVANGRIWDVANLFIREEGPNGAVQIRSMGLGALAFAIDDGSATADTIPFGEWRYIGLRRTLGSGEVLGRTPPFAPTRVYEVTPSVAVWIGITDQYQIHRIGLGGDTLRSVLRDLAQTPLTEDHAAEVKAWAEERYAEGWEQDDDALPNTYPAFSSVIEAEDGHLWVQRSTVPWESEFDVFDPDGRYLGAITSNLSTLTHPFIGSSYVIGVSVDSLDVQYVEVYRVIRP